MDLPLLSLTVHFRLDPKNITENPKFGKIPSCQIRKVLIFWTRRVWRNRISPYFLDKACLAKTRKSLFLSKKKSPYFKQTSVYNCDFQAFRGADIDGNSTMTPMEFMTWFEKNYGRMVRKGIRPRVSEERLYELACGTF